MSRTELSDIDFRALLQGSFAYCQQLTRKHAKNFYYGLCLSPKSKRLGLYAIYAWMKTLDDVVDGEATIVEKQNQLNDFYTDTIAVLDPHFTYQQYLPKEKFWLAFRETILNYQIPFEYLQAMFDGQSQDIQSAIFNNFSELYQYCYRVASTVGLICIKIWGHDQNKNVTQLAEYQGIAFQLTNILRDITTDTKLGRDYLPGAPHTKEQRHRVINELITKTAEYYEKSKALVNYIHPDGRASLRAMTNIYYQIFLKLKANPEKILYQKPIKLNLFQKIFLMFKTELVIESSPD